MAQIASVVVMPPIVEYLPDLSKQHIVGLFCFMRLHSAQADMSYPSSQKATTTIPGRPAPLRPAPRGV